MAIHLEPLAGECDCLPAAAVYANCFWRAGTERSKAFGDGLGRPTMGRLMAGPQRRIKN